MPVPVVPLTGSAAALAALVTAGKILDTSSNVLQGVAVLVDWAKAQEGLKYNDHVFELTKDAPKVEDTKPASLASPHKGSKSSTVVTSNKPNIQKTSVPFGPFLKIMVGKKNSFSFGVFLTSSDKAIPFQIGQVFLINAVGFDTAIGDQAELSFSGTLLSDIGYLLTFQGFINPFGPGFVRISGSVVIDKNGKITGNNNWLIKNGFPESIPWGNGAYQVKI